MHLQKQVKEKNYNLLRIQNWEQKQFLQLRRDNMQTLFKFTHERDVEEIQQNEVTIKAETDQIRKKIEAEKHASVKRISAESVRVLAE